MKISKLARIEEFQTGSVVKPVENAAAVQQLGAIEVPKNEDGMIKHIDTISALLKRDAGENQ